MTEQTPQMHVVVGLWELDPARRDLQPRRSHTFIVVADRPSAEVFADDVRGDFEGQALAGVTNVGLEIATVTATT
jgi:hypothetical protein